MMTLRLEIKPEIEASLHAQADARGIPLSEYVQRAIEDLAMHNLSKPGTVQEIEAEFDALAQMGADLPRLPSAAFNRESIYRDRY